MKNKIVYIIPGHGETHLRQRVYGKVGKIFAGRGITPTQVEIDWNYAEPKSFTEYQKQFLKVYKKSKNTEVYVLGFSFGAMIAFLTAAKAKPDVLILCSLSPYFKEDLKNLKPAWVKWWRKNFIDNNYTFAKLAPKVKSQVILIVGGEESKVCLIRAKEAKKKLSNAHLYIAKGAKHKIGQKEYLHEIEKVVSRLG